MVGGRSHYSLSCMLRVALGVLQYAGQASNHIWHPRKRDQNRVERHLLRHIVSGHQGGDLAIDRAPWALTSAAMHASPAAITRSLISGGRLLLRQRQ